MQVEQNIDKKNTETTNDTGWGDSFEAILYVLPLGGLPRC